MMQDRQYQAEAVNSIFAYYAGNTGNPVIAMPTASGKSIVIARFVRTVLEQWPNQRIAIITHVKELIQQNYSKFMAIWPGAPAGIFSAGLDRRDVALPVIFGGVQSMVNCVPRFGWRDLLLVDEAHLISGREDSNYAKLIQGFRAINPNVKVIGFSATPYRTGTGLISDGPTFTDICYDITSMEAFNKLIDEGFLCKLIPKRTQTQLDVSDVAIQRGDFVQGELQKAVDKDAITYAACKEIVEQGQDRQSWLIFASGLEHAKHIVAILQSFGIDAVAVHSKMDGEARDKAISDFKSFKIRCVVNYNVMTTGFDHPGLDLIAMLRPTTSTVLWVQMLGRGCRPSPETMKQNCLVLDFAGNTRRLGPINDPVIPKLRGSKEGTAPVKICPECGTYNHTRVEFCCNCNYKFEAAPKITMHASNEELIRTVKEPIIKTFKVQRAIYNKHQKAGSSPVIKVSYCCGLQMFHEYVCLEHSGTIRRKAQEWWIQRMGTVAPTTVDVALMQVAQLKVPREIQVLVNQKYPEVKAVIF